MKTTTHFEYIEWRNAAGLHEDSKQAICELKFTRDELHFLRDLVTKHTLDLIYGKPYEITIKIGSELHNYENRARVLLQELKKHSNNLQILLDDIDVPDELKEYKNIHYKLMVTLMDFHADVKKTKREIFSMLSEIMKKNTIKPIANK